jgi:solute carrier family 25 (adenine nucleotide translocator) protein 4/5/6/31
MKRCREAIGQPELDGIAFRAAAPTGQSSLFPLATSSLPQNATAAATATTTRPPIPVTRRVPKAWRDALAGALSGAFARTVTAPVERVKLILQLQNSTKQQHPYYHRTPPQQQQEQQQRGRGLSRSRGAAWDVCWQIYQQEGIVAFWRGNGQNILRVAGQAGLHFALMDYYKSLASSKWLLDRGGTVLQQHRKNGIPTTTTTTTTESQKEQFQRWMVSFVAGGLSGATTTTLLYPTEFLRTRLALDVGRRRTTTTTTSTTKRPSSTSTSSFPGQQPIRQYRGMKDIVVEVLRTDGIKGMYQGYGISLGGSVVYRLLYLGGYDAAKEEVLLWKHRARPIQDERVFVVTDRNPINPNSVDMTWTERFVLAQVVSLSAGTVCYPIDSVRRRMMMQAGKAIDERKYVSSIQCFHVMWTTEGIRGFYLGFGPNIVRSIGGALALVAYDALKETMG